MHATHREALEQWCRSRTTQGTMSMTPVSSEQPWESLTYRGGRGGHLGRLLKDSSHTELPEADHACNLRQAQPEEMLGPLGHPASSGRCHNGKSHGILSPNSATESLWNLWQVAAPALVFCFPIYTPKLLDLISSRPGYKGCTSPIPQYLPG